MRPQSHTAERKIAAIANRAHGVVTRQELLAAGLTPDEIRRRLRKGSLIREFPGVYRVGHRAWSVEALYMAALKACGVGAVLSGMAAARLYGLLQGRVIPSPEVTAERQRRVKGVWTRRARHLDRRDVTTWQGIPITTVARTVVDLAPALSFDDFARVCHVARVKYGLAWGAVGEVLLRRPNSQGASVVRQVYLGDTRVTLSFLEDRFLELLAANDLPLPETNRRVGKAYVDCRWVEPPLTVELDSYRYHGSRHAWEQDRRRERLARARGEEYRRYTYGDVCEDPTLVLVELRALLHQRRVA